MTVVGEPGIGKTRLVADLRRTPGSRRSGVAWRRGRCLPYGESVTFAPARGDRARRHRCDALRRSASGVAAKLTRPHRALGGAGGRSRVAPRSDRAPRRAGGAERGAARPRGILHGLDTVAGGRGLDGRRSCSWSRTCSGPTRPCSTSWSSSGDHAGDAPILVLGTARPELFDERSAWGERPNASVITLSPMPEQEMRELLAELLDALHPARRHAGTARAARGRQPAVCPRVRADARGPGGRRATPARSRCRTRSMP